MESGAPEGGLIIQVMDATTRNIFESTNNLTGNDMQIMGGYEIKLTPPQTNEKGMANYNSYYRKADGSPIVLEALTPGEWELRIAGYNGWDEENSTVAGEQIAYLDPGSDYTYEGRITFNIQRGKVTTINSSDAVLVPIRSSTGALDIVVDWSALNSVDEQKLYNNPDVSVTVTQINERFSNYPTRDWTAVSGVLTQTETKILTKVMGTSSTIAFAALPVGWYEVIATLTSSSTGNSGGVTQLKRMGYVRVIQAYDIGNDVTTTGTFSITDATSFATGSLDLSISEEMDPLSVSFTEIGSPEGINYPNTDGFGGDMAFGSFEVGGATGADAANTLSYAWYVNGELVSGQTAASMIYSFSEAGQYTITAVVYETSTTGAVNWGGSASHEVVVGSGLGTKELLTVSIEEDLANDTYTATATNTQEATTPDLHYLWYNDTDMVMNHDSNTYIVADTEFLNLNVFVYEIVDGGVCVRWGGSYKKENYR